MFKNERENLYILVTVFLLSDGHYSLKYMIINKLACEACAEALISEICQRQT